MIGQSISKAIKNQNWLLIEYLNKEDEITNYWIAIKDIDLDYKSFNVSAFNVAKINKDSKGIIDINIYFEKIKKAYVLDLSTYKQPEKLINKIESNLDKLSWLKYDLYQDNLIDYINECILDEETPYQKEMTLIREIDQEKLNNLKTNEKYFLTLEQIADLVPKIERLSKNKENNIYEVETLVLNNLSIKTKYGLYVVAYQRLLFNPLEQSFVLDKTTLFNYEFLNKEGNYRHNLKNYLDMEVDDFTSLFISENKEAIRMLHEVLKPSEAIDTKPYIMDLAKRVNSYIEKELNIIKEKKKNNALPAPLKAFFGNMTSQRGRIRNVDVVLIDKRINIDQLRVIYNSLTRPVTYVQGPPGTGKTHTILSVLMSSFFNDDTVLVTSNNNKPISDIYDKITSFNHENRKIVLPFIRLGNKEEIYQSLEYIKSLLLTIKTQNIYEDRLDKIKGISSSEMKEINEYISNYERKLELEEAIDVLETTKKKLNLELRSLVVNDMLNKYKKELNDIGEIDEKNLIEKMRVMDKDFYTWLRYTSFKYLKRLFEPKNNNLLEIINHEDKDEKVFKFNKYLKDPKNFSNFQKIFPIILTTNQSAHRLGEQIESFDLVVIDEAGQSSLGYSLFPIARGKRLLLVGDQNQLKPVITIAKENQEDLIKKYEIGNSYDYLENSILLTMQKVDTISKSILLRYHYRSRKKIIDFSNQKYYNNQLIISPDENLEDKALESINVNSKKFYVNQKNTSFGEIEAIINDIKNKKYKDVGIITPFRNQANLIEEIIKDNKLDATVGTVHTFQGDQKDVIYLSTGITDKSHFKSFDWIKNNQELINVATTRAKNKFILVSDEKEIKKRSNIKNDLFELAEYVSKNGRKVKLTKSNQTYFINGANFRNFDSKKEEEFFETISHLLTTADNYVLRSKVRIASILNKFITNEKYDFALKGEFDLVIFRNVSGVQMPVVVIELDGAEHKEDMKVIKRDRIKEEICKDNKIRLIRIDNKYSRRYLFIKELLKNILEV